MLHYSYFLFHAALVHSVCLCAEPDSPFATNWRADLEITHNLLLTRFSSNPLALRSLQVLERLVPKVAQPGDPDPSFNFEPTLMDFSMWPVDTDDPLNAFGWPEYGTGA
jgi:transcriptional regulatory protein GAL4